MYVSMQFTTTTCRMNSNQFKFMWHVSVAKCHTHVGGLSCDTLLIRNCCYSDMSQRQVTSCVMYVILSWGIDMSQRQVTSCILYVILSWGHITPVFNSIVFPLDFASSPRRQKHWVSMLCVWLSECHSTDGQRRLLSRRDDWHIGVCQQQLNKRYCGDSNVALSNCWFYCQHRYCKLNCSTIEF